MNLLRQCVRKQTGRWFSTGLYRAKDCKVQDLRYGAKLLVRILAYPLLVFFYCPLSDLRVDGAVIISNVARFERNEVN